MAHERNVLVGKQRGNAEWLPVPSLSFTPVEVPVHDVSAPAQTVGGPFHPVLGFGGGLALRVPSQSTSEGAGEVRRLMGEEPWRLQGGSDHAWRVLAQGRILEENCEPTGSRKEAILRGVPAEFAALW